MSVASQLHIIVPGVCGPLADTRSLENNRFIKNWIRTLSRAQCISSPTTFNDLVVSLFNFSIADDFPSAALAMLASNNYKKSSNYMFADPVHLQADMDHAILTSSKDLAISEHEADVFCEMFNQHFDQDGFHFNQLDRNRWIISSEDSIKLNTTPLVDAIGRNVNFILPGGESSRYWKQKLTEAQMLMHTHEINSHRESAGQHSINSLWLYGSGKLPDFDRCGIDSVCSDDILFKGIASHIQCDYMPLFKSVDGLIDHLSDHRVVSHTSSNNKRVDVLHLAALEHLVNYSDVRIWTEELEDIVSGWIYPLLKMAYKNNIKVTLFPCNGKQYQFSQYDRFKFWRQQNLSQHLSSY